ncbi:MAG: aldehyde ferredoxin oxidoreductase family protein [Promethearchaeia archaeon]
MNNKVVSINLSEENSAEHELSDEILGKYIGGRGLGVKLFTDRIKPKIDPLGPENILIFTTGPFGGTSVPTNGRFSLVTKSPLTNGIFYANSGGSFGVFMKKCGFDGLLLNGKAERPSYIVIEEGKEPEIKDASNLWGLDTEKTLSNLKEIEGEKIYALIVGPAGENLVKIAAIINDAERAFGRGGVGAVMGSKNLKAIVVKQGTKKVEVDDLELLKKYVKMAMDKIKIVPITRSALPKFGTSALVNVINRLGMFPIKNFQKGQDERSKQVSGEQIRKQLLQKDEGCYGCPIRCGRITKAGGMTGKGPEYESVWALGPNLGIFDLETVAQANYLCNQLGLDTISCGGSIACAMELQQKGLLQEDMLTFGNVQDLKEIVKKIAYKEGIGADISEGAKRLAEKYNASESAIHVKGLEIPAYDPRGAIGHALGYATANRGGDHLTGYLAAMEIFAAPKKINRFTTGGKPDLLALKQNQKAVEDSLVLCTFGGWALGLDFYARFLHAITGKEYNVTNLTRIGERIYTLEKLYNLQEGLGKKDDTLPPRFLEKPFEQGPSKGHVVPLEKMRDQYYYVRKWDEQGVPSQELLDELELTSDVAGGG